MSKNFDSERRSWAIEARTFTLGGETFVAREHIRPEVIADFEDGTSSDGDRSLHKLIAATDRAILAMIEGGESIDGAGASVSGSARERYLALRSSPDGAINLDQLSEVAKWLVEQHTNRPTEPSSPSGNGHGGTGMTSTATSSPPAAPVPITSPSGT